MYTDGQPLMLDDIEKDLPANSSKLLTESKWTFITQESDECLLLQLLAKFPSILVALYINNQDIRLAAMSCIEGLFKVWPCVTLSGRNNGSALGSQFLGELLGLLIQQQRLIVSDENILLSLFTNLLGTSHHSILVSESVGQS
ncbi:uncharacterized protein At3g06530-like isoform X2 [Apium graveolens]|uniref:uncharacterized protein At3g06530-like isoform X2 n=1 Tax=Apium graveolens TaxID=4045 RepID=UPI003D7B06D3